MVHASLISHFHVNAKNRNQRISNFEMRILQGIIPRHALTIENLYLFPATPVFPVFVLHFTDGAGGSPEQQD